jgi:hypothetical protein
VPLITIAILLVTEALTDAVTLVEAGNVMVVVPAMAGAATVTVPLVSPVIKIELIFKLLLVKNVY